MRIRHRYSIEFHRLQYIGNVKSLLYFAIRCKYKRVRCKTGKMQIFVVEMQLSVNYIIDKTLIEKSALTGTS